MFSPAYHSVAVLRAGGVGSARKFATARATMLTQPAA
jgi:hypothetical protein